MSSTYSRWINHGEDNNVHVLEEPTVLEDANVDSFVSEDTNDCGLEGMLAELVRSEQHGNEATLEGGNEDAASCFKQLIEETKRELYPG
jgi:tyrosyl-tRNA synthetase